MTSRKGLRSATCTSRGEHGWSEDEMSLNMKSSSNQSRNIKKRNKGRFFKGRCNHCGKFGHKKADCWDLKNKREKSQENEKKVRKDKSNVRCFNYKKLGHYANECRNEKDSSGDDKHVTYVMTCYENSEKEKCENEEEENKQESKNLDVDEINIDPGTARNTEDPQGTPLTQSYISNIYMIGITSEWVMNMIEDSLATPRVTCSVRAWIESSKHGQGEIIRNMIIVQLAREKSTIEHRSSNISHPGENVAHAQPSVSHKEEEIQNSNFEYESTKRPSEDLEEDDRKPAAKKIKKEPEDEAQSWAKDEQIEKPTFKPWEDKKDYEPIFRKFISIGEDGEEHYDVIDMEIEAQRAVRRITDHQEIVKQYQKVVRAYNNFMKDYPWKSTEGLMQDNCRFGDMLKDEKRNSQFKHELGRLMGEYAVPLPCQFQHE